MPILTELTVDVTARSRHMPYFASHNQSTRLDHAGPAAEMPAIAAQAGPYSLRLVRTEQDLLEVCRLRFRIFNLELGEGLPRSYQSGADCDRFDRQCHHLMVEHKRHGVIGTYRLQIAETAVEEGFYSAQEFDLNPLKASVLPQSVELGRACIAKEHRKRKVLYLLWSGLITYANHFNKRYFFGCNSLTTQDPALGWQTFDWLQNQNHLHAHFLLSPTEAHRCHQAAPAICSDSAQPAGRRPSVTGVPQLFAAYLRYGSKVCSKPAIDREFGTIDFLTLLDLHQLSPIQRARFRA
jgi:putative hemolysin